ncbi:MAG: tetratricopeptide repeat protein [Rhodopirellula sp.]|nr:tetratricopeptide repeat protein [Rhodopirellula sp.]
MYTVNKSLLALLLIAAVCLGGLVHWVHGVQNRRHADFFLQRARTAKVEERPEEAVEEFRRYLRLAPGDAAARAELGLLLAEHSRWAEAFTTLEETLRQAPDRQDVRRKLAEVAIRLRRPSDAASHLAILIDRSPDDSELCELLAATLAARGNDSSAVDALKTAVEKDPDRLSAYLALSNLLRAKLGRPAEADQWMDKAVQANPSSPDAHCLRGEYRLRTGRLEQAEADAAAALRLAPDLPAALRLAAQCASEAGRYDEARAHGRWGLQQDPEDQRMRMILADAELSGGNLDGAVATVREGLRSGPGDAALLHSLAMILMGGGKTAEAATVIEQLDQMRYPKPLVALLEAMRAYHEGRWVAARDGLEKVRKQLGPFPDLARQAEYHLAECHARLGQRDQQLAAYRRTLAIQRDFTAARLKMAELLFAEGEIDEALALHRQTMQAKAAPASGWLLWARLLLADTLRRPPAERDWTEMESVLKQAPEEQTEALEWTLLRADVLALQGSSEEAEKLLAKACQDDPSQVGAWAARLVFAERRKAWEEVERLMDEAAEHCGDRAPLRLARLRQASVREPASVPKLLETLAADTESLSPAERVQLWRGLLSVATAYKAWPQSLRLCEELSREMPQDVGARAVQIDAASHAGDLDTLNRALAAVRQLEGPSALWHYGEAMRIELAAGEANPAQMAAALAHLSEAHALRPDWPLPLLASAAIHRKQGDLAQAADECRQAIELGVRDPDVIRSTVNLLYQQGQFDDAYQLLRRIESQQPGITQSMGRVGSELSLRHADLSAAVTAARAAAKDSSDPQDFLWLGQVLAVAAAGAGSAGEGSSAADTLQEAEKALRHGLGLDPARPAAWVLLVRFLAGAGRKDDAEATIKRAEDSLEREGRLLALAQCYKAIGLIAKAEDCYRQAVADRPNDPVVLRSAAEFYLQQNQPRQAKESVEKMLRLGEKLKTSDTHWARRSMAVLMLEGGYRNLLPAIALVDRNLQSPQAANEDRCVKAMLLASHPRLEERRQSVRMLEEVLRQDRSLSRYRLVAADVYRKLGDWGGEARHMRDFLASNPSHPAALAAYVRGMLQHNELTDAAEWINRLERTAPDSLETARLRLVWLLKRGEYDKATKRLTAIRFNKEDSGPAVADSGPSKLARQLPDLLAALAPAAAECRHDAKAASFLAAAEKMLRELAAVDPAKAMALAGWLAHLGRTGESLEVVERYGPTPPPQPLQQTLLKLQTACLKQPALAERMLKLVGDLSVRFDRPTAFLLIQAELETALGHYQEAENRYREAVQKQPSNVVACNNLAVLLALQKKDLDEALKLVSVAMEEAGPLATLRDSLAVVHLARGNAQAAVEELDAAIADDPAAIFWFHRALVQDRLGQPEAAVAALKKAEELAEGPVEVHPLERPEYERLRAAVIRPSTSSS